MRTAPASCMRVLGSTVALEVVGSESRMTCDPREHPRTDLIIVVEAEDEIGPPRPTERAVGARLSLE
jgi:hypothetical protein